MLNFRVRDGNGCDPVDKITGKLVTQWSVAGGRMSVKDKSGRSGHLLLWIFNRTDLKFQIYDLKFEKIGLDI
jgi:hypothetical protein